MPSAGAASSWTNIAEGPLPEPGEPFLPSMAYDPMAHAVVLFGGYRRDRGRAADLRPEHLDVRQRTLDERDPQCDLHGHDLPVATGRRHGGLRCSLGGLLLFGGYKFSAAITYIAYQDTWLFSNGTRRTSGSVGTPPSSRLSGAMVFDTIDNDVLLFGGLDDSQHSLGDTWTFSGTFGTWKNITTTTGHGPISRDGAAIANSPSAAS